jgi:3-oxoacyl-[acyl-carrier-protein] synthase-3
MASQGAGSDCACSHNQVSGAVQTVLAVDRKKNMHIRPVGIVGTGSYLPNKKLTNFDLEKMVETSDEWITTRTGISERHIVSDEQATSDLAVPACQKALQAAGMKPEEIDLIIVGTITPDTLLPSCACWVQHGLGARNAAAFDVTAACSGFIYALSIAHSLIATGGYDTALVVGAEVLSSITDFQDRNTCVLFGDGAGAVVLKAQNGSGQILDSFMAADGSGAEMMILPAGGSRIPASHYSISQRLHYMRIRGREVFKFAVLTMARLVRETAERNNLSVQDIRLIIPHQVNARIISAAMERLNLPLERAYVNINRVGNTSAASIPIALDEAVRKNYISKGDYIVLVAFGGGLTWASALLRW